MLAVAPAVLPASSQEAIGRRNLLFRESLPERLERWALGTAWALKPQRIRTLPALARIWAIDLIAPRHDLPNSSTLPVEQSGMCGIAHDLSTPILIEAYQRGLYAFAHFGPLKWFCPPERCVLFFDQMHVGKTVRKGLRQQRYRVTFDTDFEGVIKSCAGRREGKWHVTWITPRIMRAYAALYDAGFVHSFEVWNSRDELVGGGYGVAIGDVFFTESQFSHERDTSKLGFTVLNWHLARWGFLLNDGKGPTPTILTMGFRNIPRADFLDHLRYATQAPGKPGRWKVEVDLPTVADWRVQAATRPAREQPAAA